MVALDGGGGGLRLDSNKKGKEKKRKGERRNGCSESEMKEMVNRGFKGREMRFEILQFSP